MDTFFLSRKKREEDIEKESLRERDLHFVIFFVKFFDINIVSLSLACIQHDHKLLSATNPVFVFTVYLLYASERSGITHYLRNRGDSPLSDCGHELSQ
jgi:hypothetical protein